MLDIVLQCSSHQHDENCNVLNPRTNGCATFSMWLKLFFVGYIDKSFPLATKGVANPQIAKATTPYTQQHSLYIIIIYKHI